VCGELVFRGDECVSLGWCFWHRGCYGCLFYGSRLIVVGPSVQKVFAERSPNDPTHNQRVASRNDEKSHVAEIGLSKGLEISDVPMCANCAVDIEMDELDRAAVVQKALRRVDKTDGGLGRKRWERREDVISPPAMEAFGKSPAQQIESSIRVRSSVRIGRLMVTSLKAY
jgi:hypothetical protein